MNKRKLLLRSFTLIFILGIAFGLTQLPKRITERDIVGHWSNCAFSANKSCTPGRAMFKTYYPNGILELSSNVIKQDLVGKWSFHDDLLEETIEYDRSNADINRNKVTEVYKIEIAKSLFNNDVMKQAEQETKIYNSTGRATVTDGHDIFEYWVKTAEVEK